MTTEALPAGQLGRSARRHALSPLRLLAVARRKPLGAVSALVLIVIWALALLSPLVAPYGWDDLYTGPLLAGPTLVQHHFFGTDQNGRDVFSRVLFGGRITLIASLAATAGAVALGALFGVISGYAMGLYDLIFQRISDGFQALPGLVVLMVVTAVFPENRTAVLVALAILQAPFIGRTLRSETMKIRSMAYIEAADSLGASHTRVVARHVLPNVVPLMIIVFTVVIGSNMLILTALAFLGVVDPATPDWGTMLNVGAQQYAVAAPWMAIFPGAAITLSVLAYNLLGDAMRDLLDPRLRGS